MDSQNLQGLRARIARNMLAVKEMRAFRDLREERNIPAVCMAAELRITTETLRRWESGKHVPRKWKRVREGWLVALDRLKRTKTAKKTAKAS